MRARIFRLAVPNGSRRARRRAPRPVSKRASESVVSWRCARLAVGKYEAKPRRCGGKPSRHSRSVVATVGPSGTARCPAFDFGFANLVVSVCTLSRTCSLPPLRSTSDHRSPRSSDARRPGEGRSHAAMAADASAAARMALTSSGAGISTPTSSLPSLRLSASIRLTPSATFCATLPRRCASRRSDLRLADEPCAP